MPEFIENTEELKNLWQSQHRGNLHNLDSWKIEGNRVEADDERVLSSHQTPSITYAGSGAAASGHDQLKSFFEIYPASKHTFNGSQLSRFNNEFKSLSCSVDQRRVTEELLVSALHYERMDWLVPGLGATNRTFTITFVLLLVPINFLGDNRSIWRRR